MEIICRSVSQMSFDFWCEISCYNVTSVKALKDWWRLYLMWVFAIFQIGYCARTLLSNSNSSEDPPNQTTSCTTCFYTCGVKVLKIVVEHQYLHLRVHFHSCIERQTITTQTVCFSTCFNKPWNLGSWYIIRAHGLPPPTVEWINLGLGTLANRSYISPQNQKNRSFTRMV